MAKKRISNIEIFAASCAEAELLRESIKKQNRIIELLEEKNNLLEEICNEIAKNGQDKANMVSLEK